MIDKPGNYTVDVTGANGCISSCSTVLDLAVSATIDSITPDNGSANGTIALSVSGGSPSYHFLWSNGDNTSDVTNLAHGSYAVTITDMKGCIDSLTFVVDFINGIMTRQEEGIRITPNPANEILHVSLPNSHYPIRMITITDITGKEMLQTTETAISVKDLSDGLYFVKVELLNGKGVVRKVVVE